MLNIVIPMAGYGSRFSAAGFKDPKPLIKVRGLSMIESVIANLRPKSIPHQFIFICQLDHLKNYDLADKLLMHDKDAKILSVDSVTQGAACTVLLAKGLIDNINPLMIANCDQLIDCNIDEYINKLNNSSDDGIIMTMNSNNPKWSYVKINNLGKAVMVVEKEVVSNDATVGIYNFRHGFEFVAAAELMISKNLRVNGEFYVAPVYNQLIKSGKSFSCFNIGSEGSGMYGLGTPADLLWFEKHNPMVKLG
jgi:dTDP-glucose pyrophosphorylase